jgi:hypothetical protein
MMKAVKVVVLACIFFSLGAGEALAATLYANSSTGNDTTGAGTIGSPYKTFHKAYTSASSGDTIHLTGTFTWTNTDETGDAVTSGYTLSKNLTIVGQGADETIVQATTSDNTADRRVFTVANTYTVTFSGLTIRYGKVGSSQNGGGIDVIGTATFDACDISYNRATDGGGGGINVWGTATVASSTVHHNVAHYMGGGLNRYYYTSGNGTPNGTHTMDIINSTVSSNTVTQTVAYLEGGGVFYRRGSGAITNSTITLNQVVNGGTSRSTHGLGTGDGAGTIQLKNNIIAGNVLSTNGGDIGHRENGYGVYADNGGNIIGRPGFYRSGFTAASTTWLDATTYSTSIDGTYVLQDGGGATSGTLNLDSALAANSTLNGTQTFAITSGTSIAVNNGLTGSNGATTTVPTTDQRGASRSGNIDVGAYEYNGDLGADVTVPTVSVTAPTSGQTVSGTVSLAASASDNVAVAGVRFYVDGVAQGGEDTTSTYGISWDSTATTTGTHSVFAVARDSSNNYATSSTVSFTVDNTVAGLSDITVVASTTYATITWTSDEAASTRVYFGPTSSFGTSTPETDTSPRVTSHSVVISGLKTCARYYYKVQSTDASSNTASSTPATFRTIGCTGSAPISSTGQGSITTAAGGTLSEGRLTLTVPTSFTSTTSEAVFQAHLLDGSTFFANAGAPSGKSRAGSTVYNLVALTDATTTLSSFSAGLTVTLSYTDEDIEGVDESTLKIHRYDDSVWNELSSCSVDTTANTVTCTTTHFSDFAIFGDAASSSSNSSSDRSSRSGSIKQRVETLSRIGNVAAAVALASEWPSVFATPSPVATNTEPLVSKTVLAGFATTLRPGETHADVKRMQQFLNANGFTVATRGPGAPGEETEYFGTRTQLALARFQEAHAAHILAPAGLARATGLFGPLTRAFVNTLASSSLSTN